MIKNKTTKVYMDQAHFLHHSQGSAHRMMQSEDPRGARLLPGVFWQTLQPGCFCSFLGSLCLNFPLCREGAKNESILQ